MVEEEYFGTLGGSLMKDLLADLQVDDGDFSLDQLERELAELDNEPMQPLPNQGLPSFDAASLVVSHALGRAGGMPTTPATRVTNQGVDAWSLSLQNFTAMSLQEDFLAADSARKQQTTSDMTSDLQPTVLDGAEDYDIGEKAHVAPPPGLGDLMAQMASKPPAPKPFPKTPQNSINIARPAEPEESKMPPQTESSMSQPKPQKQNQQRAVPPTVSNTSQGVLQQNAPTGYTPAMPPQSVPTMQGMPIAGVVMPPPGAMPPMAIPPGGMMQPVPFQPVVAGAVPTGGPAWQSPVRPPMPPPMRVFCNPLPNAPPIPATALESEFMTARDIAFVVHAILKPVLAAGISNDDYHIEFLRRRGGGPQANASNPKEKKDINEEMSSRATKTKEWASEKGVLGVIAKTNVTRPRALIATPQAPSEKDVEQKQRASLWKARIYCDQAYQAYQMVVDVWKTAPPGSVPPEVQAHLSRLMKCMGITSHNKEYRVDAKPMELLMKLGKGRTLISRVLEQTLLPPSALLTALPTFLDVHLRTASNNKSPQAAALTSEDMSNERLFRAIASVIRKLSTSSETLLKCLEVAQKSGKAALSTTARMECVHVLLQKGAVVVGQDPSEDVRSAWGKAETEFMSLLQAF